MPSHVEAFRAAMAEHGLSFSGLIFGDGKLHRFKVDGDKDSASWYVLHDNPQFAAGAFGCWRRGFEEKWHSNGDDLSPEERKRLKEQWAAADKDRRTEEEKRQTECKKLASQLMSAARPVSPEHPYLTKKRVGVHGNMREDKERCLLLPLIDLQNSTRTLQLIAPDKRFHGERDKDFLSGGKVHGCFYPVNDSASGPLVICEGYATGASIYEATGWATYCAMFAGNLLPVAKTLRTAFPARTIIIAADNDRFTSTNVGIDKAKEAAKQVKCEVCIPEFADEDLTSTDFNDLACTSGLGSVRRSFEAICPLSFLSADHVLGLVLPKEHILMGEHVLSLGNLCAVIAPGGVGKSSWALQLCAAAVAGHEKFLAWPLSRDFSALRWMFIQAENSAYRLQQDMKRIRDWLGPDSWKRFCEQVRVLVPLKDSDSFLDLDNPEVPIRLSRSIELFQPNIVVFDALYNFTLRELSKGSEMLAAVSSCVRVAKLGNPNRLPLLLHHALPGSSGSSRITGFDRANYGRDSKVLHQLCRSVINIGEASDEDPSRLIITCGKNSDGPEFKPFLVRRHPETLIYEVDNSSDIIAVLENLKHPHSPKVTLTPEQVVDMVPDMVGINRTKLRDAIIAKTGCSRATGYRHMDVALARGLICEDKRFPGLVFRKAPPPDEKP